MAGEKPRQIALRVLKRYEGQAEYLEDLLDAEVSRANLSPADRGLCRELAFGTVRWQKALDWLIAQKTGRPQKPALQILLRLGLYQLFWLQRVPEHAAVHETIEAAKKAGLESKAGFLNAVLRGYARERAQTEQALQALKAAQPAVGYSHPEWLVERWHKRWGPEKLEALLRWNNTAPVNFARLNTLRTDSARLLTQWQEEGVQFQARHWDWAAEGLFHEVVPPVPFPQLGSFREGRFYIQDPSTALAVVALNPQKGETVLDQCAAPGGKTTLIAQVMQNTGRIVAHDPHVARRDLIRENCLRLGVINVQITHPESAHLHETVEPYDRILVDAPCSNTGVMRRRVDLRWRLHPEEIQRLSGAQLELLVSSSAHLKPGGTLVYSTCSLEPDENEAVVRGFLARNPQFTVEFERTLLPFTDGVDGAYVARLEHQPIRT